MLLNRKWPHLQRQEAPSWPSFHGCWFWPSSVCEGRGRIWSLPSWPPAPGRLCAPSRPRSALGKGSWTSRPESLAVPSLWWAAGAEAARPEAAGWRRPPGACGRPGCCSSAWLCALPPSVSGRGTCRSRAAAWWGRGWRRSTRTSTARSRHSPAYTRRGRGRPRCWCQIWWGRPPPGPGSTWLTAGPPGADPRASCCSWVVLRQQWTCSRGAERLFIVSLTMVPRNPQPDPRATGSAPFQQEVNLEQRWTFACGGSSCLRASHEKLPLCSSALHGHHELVQLLIDLIRDYNAHGRNKIRRANVTKENWISVTDVLLEVLIATLYSSPVLDSQAVLMRAGHRVMRPACLRWTPRTSRVCFILNGLNYLDCFIWFKHLNAAGCSQKAPDHHHQSTLAWWPPSVTDLIVFFWRCDKRLGERSGFSAQVSIRQHQPRVQIISLSPTDAGQSSRSITADASFMWSLKLFCLLQFYFFFHQGSFYRKQTKGHHCISLSAGWGWPTGPDIFSKLDHLRFWFDCLAAAGWPSHVH